MARSDEDGTTGRRTTVSHLAHAEDAVQVIITEIIAVQEIIAASMATVRAKTAKERESMELMMKR